jgi:hypothetical protein
MQRNNKSEIVYSKPTMCLNCHLVVEMTHGRHADPHNGAWECPRCRRAYPFAYWKIAKRTSPKPLSVA